VDNPSEAIGWLRGLELIFSIISMGFVGFSRRAAPLKNRRFDFLSRGLAGFRLERLGEKTAKLPTKLFARVLLKDSAIIRL